MKKCELLWKRRAKADLQSKQAYIKEYVQFSFVLN